MPLFSSTAAGTGHLCNDPAHMHIKNTALPPYAATLQFKSKHNKTKLPPSKLRLTMHASNTCPSVVSNAKLLHARCCCRVMFMPAVPYTNRSTVVPCAMQPQPSQGYPRHAGPHMQSINCKRKHYHSDAVACTARQSSKHSKAGYKLSLNTSFTSNSICHSTSSHARLAKCCMLEGPHQQFET
jgi:hypothetical protein